ncbi:hypothetical protein AKJ16_DCAP09691, partial [Drosera capensis]
ILLNFESEKKKKQKTEHYQHRNQIAWTRRTRSTAAVGRRSLSGLRHWILIFFVRVQFWVLVLHCSDIDEDYVEGSLSWRALMGDLFASILNLTSCISSQFIRFVEDIEFCGSSNHGPMYFVGTKRFFSKMGLACHIAKIHSEASVEHNALELMQYTEELYWGSSKRVMLLGHSKGGVDAAAALSIYWSHLKDKVAGLALVQSPYGGTPIASDILREGQLADKKTRRGDLRSIEDLTYEKRKEFVLKHKLPDQIPLISFNSEANTALGVLWTMNHIAHAELSWLPQLRFMGEASSDGNDDVVSRSARVVPVMLPWPSRLFTCCSDTEKRATPDWKFDHGWMVYSSRKKNCDEPDAAEMCEAILTMLIELGKAKMEV